MGSRTKRIDLDEVPGAKEHQVKWLMCSGVRTVTRAKKLAKAFIADLARVAGHADERRKGNKGSA
jgi:hypothetical protein